MDSNEFFLRLMGGVAILSFLFICYFFYWFRQFAKNDGLYGRMYSKNAPMEKCLCTWLTCMIFGLSMNSIFWHKPWYWIALLFAVLVGPIVTFFAYDHPDNDAGDDFLKAFGIIPIVLLCGAFFGNKPSL